MRAMPLLPLLLCASLAQAAAPTAQALAPAFALAGVRLVCEQSEPMIRRGLSEAQQALLGKAFSADALCLELARRVASQLDVAELAQAEALLASPLAEAFTRAERAVGESGIEELQAYRAQLRERPPRAERLALVRRLDRAAQTSASASGLRYEIGKTQALLALKARGETLDEQALSAQTETQAKALALSSAEAVESFMLFAYRQMPSEQLAEYAALYEQEPVSRLLAASVRALPEVFAAARTTLR